MSNADNGTCRLYSANVSPYWSEENVGHDETNDANCYSTWVERPDLISSSKASTTIPLLSGSRVTDVTGGYSCFLDSRVAFIFHTADKVDNPWVLIDMQSYYWVKKVIFRVRGYATYPHHFQLVEVRVGSQSEADKFSSNELLMYMNWTVVHGEIITFERERPLYGRYVSVQSKMQKSYFIFLAMKIIPEFQ